MSYTIEIANLAFADLQAIKVFHRRQIVQSIEEQLTNTPLSETRNRKLLTGVQPQFEHDPPVWELRVGDYRVYYDVNEESKTVSIRAVRLKPPHMTTEQII